jgi:hypothetical protein
MKNKLILNFKSSMMDLSNSNKYLNLFSLFKSLIFNFYDFNFINFIFSSFYSLIFRRINFILLLLLIKLHKFTKNNKEINFFKYFFFNPTSISFTKLKNIFYYLLSLYFNFDYKNVSLNFNFIDSTLNFLRYKYLNLKDINIYILKNLKSKYLFNYLYRKNKINNKHFIK